MNVLKKPLTALPLGLGMRGETSTFSVHFILLCTTWLFTMSMYQFNNEKTLNDTKGTCTHWLQYKTWVHIKTGTPIHKGSVLEIF